MNASESQPRLMTSEEFALYIRTFREIRHWSQEQLADISGLNVRTIQRVEQGQGASFDTRRALAAAFELADIDSLNKPFPIPTEAAIKTAREKFDLEHVTLSALPLLTGRQLAKLAEASTTDLFEPAFELPHEAARSFATLVDCFREYRDCADLYSETQKLGVYDDLQARIDGLKVQGVSLLYAERQMQMKWDSDNPVVKSIPVTALYILAFPLGKEPEQFTTPKSIGVRA